MDDSDEEMKMIPVKKPIAVRKPKKIMSDSEDESESDISEDDFCMGADNDSL